MNPAPFRWMVPLACGAFVSVHAGEFTNLSFEKASVGLLLPGERVPVHELLPGWRGRALDKGVLYDFLPPGTGVTVLVKRAEPVDFGYGPTHFTLMMSPCRGGEFLEEEIIQDGLIPAGSRTLRLGTCGGRLSVAINGRKLATRFEPQSLSGNWKGPCDKGFWPGPRRRGRRIPASGLWRPIQRRPRPKELSPGGCSRKRTAGFVAPRSQTAGGYAPLSRLAIRPFPRTQGPFEFSDRLSVWVFGSECLRDHRGRCLSLGRSNGRVEAGPGPIGRWVRVLSVLRGVYTGVRNRRDLELEPDARAT